MRPMQPVPIKIGPRAALLRWKIPESLQQRAAELKQSFQRAAEGDNEAKDVSSKLDVVYHTSHRANSSNALPSRTDVVVVHRTTWLRLIDENYRPLLDFLRRAKTSNATLTHLGSATGHGSGTKLSLLDIFETADCEVVEWRWIRERLAATVEVDGDVMGISEKGMVSTGESARMVNDALVK